MYIAKHPANKGHIPKAIGRACAFQLRARLSRRPTVAEIGGLRMWVHLGNTAATKVVYGSPPDWSEMQAWRRNLTRGDLFVDVGANVGTYSLWAASCGAYVVAIEPDPVAADRLRANVRLNPRVSVEVVEAAVTDRPGTTELTIGLDAENHLGHGRTVQSVTLDDLCEGRIIAGLKIDVEGYEALVLDGAHTLLDRGAIRLIQLEWNTLSERALGTSRDAIAVSLNRSGFELARPDRRGHLVPCGAPGYGADIFAIQRGAEGDPRRPTTAM